MIKINLNDKGLGPEDEKRFTELCDGTVTITIPIGSAMVVETILKEVCDKVATDAIKAIADGNDAQAGVLATIGMEIVTLGKALNVAIGNHASFNEIKSIAMKNKDENEQGTGSEADLDNPLAAFLASRKGTLQ